MNWEPVTTALIALIATLITALVPVIVKAVFDAFTAQLTKAKAVVDKNEAVALKIVEVVQQTFNMLENSAKYQIALQRLTDELHLPPEALHDLIEQAVADMKLASGTSWEALGGKTPDVPPVPTIPDQPIPQETPVV
jgi:hypothetical protein